MTGASRIPMYVSKMYLGWYFFFDISPLYAGGRQSSIFSSLLSNKT
jgi:hypothetical protein